MTRRLTYKARLLNATLSYKAYVSALPIFYYFLFRIGQVSFVMAAAAMAASIGIYDSRDG